MADTKITDLTALATADDLDVIPIVDDPAGSPVTKKITYSNLFASFTALGQLPFPATQSASADVNTLDDYDEGNVAFTPTVTFATPGDLSVVYTAQFGAYTKIGKVVIYRVQLVTSTFTHTTASGAFRVGGLPFANGATFYTDVMMRGWTKANFTQLMGEHVSPNTYFEIKAGGSGQTPTNLTTADVPTGGTIEIRAAGFYFA